jgi:hypothetical protein
MSTVSHFFKISMGLRAVHNRLVEDYGLPYWASYLLFAFATILLGALLGLLIVCCIDIVFPAKYDVSAQRRTPEQDGKASPGGGDAIQDASEPRKNEPSDKDEEPAVVEAKKDI